MEYMLSSSTLHVPTAWLITTVIATVFVIVLPFILGGIAHNKLAVGWKYFWFGALVFLVFQLLTRVPPQQPTSCPETDHHPAVCSD